MENENNIVKFEEDIPAVLEFSFYAGVISGFAIWELCGELICRLIF